MTLISGLRVALMRPKISATASSVPTLVQPLPASSSIPDTAQVATPRDAAETSTRSRNLINQILLESGAGGMANLWRWNVPGVSQFWGGCCSGAVNAEASAVLVSASGEEIRRCFLG